MKIKSLLIGMLACTALVGCTNDDVIDNPGNENPALKGNSYLSVNLSMGNPSSRSTQEENFDNGSEAEAAVKDNNVIFLFYDAVGNYVTEGTIQYYDETNGLTEAGGSALVWTENADGSNVERTADPVVVLGPTKTVPAKVIAILNNNTLATTCKGMNMSATLDRVTNTTDYMVEGAGYVMSNSAYVDGNNVVYATDIAPEQICETAAAAVANPVDIYVERVAAKVAMSYATGVGTNDEFTLASSANGGKYMVDDQVKSLKVKVVGWTVNAINETSSLIKNITTNNYFANWNSTANYRSYWAEDVNYSGVTRVAEDATDAEPWEHTGDSFTGLTYKTWKDADKAGASSLWNGVVEYLNENTTDQPVIRPNDKTNATTLLVAGHIIVEDNSTGVTLFTYKGGYYTADAYKAILMGALKGINKVVEGENVALEARDFVWTETKEGNTIPTYKATKVDYQTVVLKPTLADGVTLEDGKTITDIHTALAAYETKLYLDGRCYYQIPIKHIFDNENADTDVCGEYGIVRNHSYNLTLTNITNIGGAVFDPESEKLDHIPGAENDYYIAATLNVLAWRVVANQNVEL